MPDIPAALRYSADHLWVRPDPGTSLVHAGVTDQEWKGWWGDNPPFHTPVFVLTTIPGRCWRWRAALRSLRRRQPH